MNCAILIARTGCDDAPIGVYETYEKAHDATFWLNDEDAIVAEMERVMKVDIGLCLNALGIVRVVDGVPQEIEIVRHYNDEVEE